MNRSRPVGSLGGGGWESGSLPEAAVNDQSSNHTKKEKVLADMYEMFLDTLEADVIACVVESCKFNHKKSIDALIEMAGTSNPTTQSSSPPREVSSTPSTQEMRKSSGQPQRNLTTFSAQPTHQVENTQLPHNVNGFGRQRNSPGPPTANLYFPARKKKITENSSGNGIAQLRWYIENEYRVMVLLRGCPGAGKSYLARGLVLSYKGDPKDFIFSTDDYFIRNNIYKFDPRSLSDAHGWNQRRCLSNAREGRSPIIIDNTNTEIWEMTAYANIAVNHGYFIVILEPNTPWAENLNELAKRNQHGVPKDKIRLMLERYDRGITVERLLASTGLKYAKPPPQRAEQSLIKLVTAKNEKFHGSQRENQANTNIFIPRSTIKKSKCMEQESMTSTILPGGFYFGPNAYKHVDFLPSNSANQEVNDERSVPLKDENRNIDLPMQKEDSDGNQTDPKSVTIENQDAIERVALNLNNSSANEGNCSEADVMEQSIESLEHINIQGTVDTLKPSIVLEGGKINDSSKNLVSSNESANVQIITFENFHNSEVGSGDALHSVLQSKENSNENSDLSSYGNLIKNNAKEEAAIKNSNGLIRLSSLSEILADESSRWSGSPDRAQRENATQNESVYQNSSPKPPRSFSLKNIQDYCNYVKDMNAASENEASGYSYSENSEVSWQPIEAEVFHQETSCSPLHVPSTSQRSKFKKFDISDKGTNTNHADFCFLYNSSDHQEDGVRVLTAYDRDINEGRVVSNNKVPLKLMLDKGTFTENDYEGEPKSKQEKIKELVRLFPNRSAASIKELLKQCDWDVNYVSNILLDDTDNPIPSFVSDENNDADSEVESSSEEEVPDDNEADKEDKTVSTDIPSSDDILPSRNAQDEAEEVKRHIEQSFDFDERCYSPHTLAIKNLRRGKREGAIPKTQPMLLSEAEISMAESPPEASSDSSDEGNETLEFIVGKDFIQQLVDKFGGSNLRTKDVSPVVKFPVDLARQIYEIILAASNSEDEEDDGDIAMKLQCEEDERMARQLYEEMLRNTGCSADSTPPPLREIMDMELAQAIYRADVNSLSKNSPDTIANVLAKRLLEENYSHIDKKALHDIFISCNCSFENTVKTLQEALSPDYPEKERKAIAQQAAAQERQKNYVDNSQGQDFTERYDSIENSIGIENPWELSDPKAAYSTYREKADEFLRERDQMYRKANEAFKRKERSVAAYYSKLGEVHGKKFQHASAMAAAALAAAQGDSLSTDVLDLHHFKVAEAVTVFDLFMDHHIGRLAEDGHLHKSLDIITGRGQHSLHGKPRIKPAISNRARKRNLRWQEAPGNPGALRVWVTPGSYLSHEVPE